MHELAWRLQQVQTRARQSAQKSPAVLAWVHTLYMTDMVWYLQRCLLV